jgi:hypothetical protein
MTRQRWLLPVTMGMVLLPTFELTVARQRRGRAGRGASLRRSPLRADCPAVRGLVATSRNSLRSLRSLRSNSRDEHDDDARWRARPPALCSSAPHRRPAPSPPPPLQMQLWRAPNASHRGGWWPMASPCAATRSAGLGAARASAHRHQTGRSCSNAANEVSAVSFATWPQARASQWSWRAAPTAAVGDASGHHPPRRADANSQSSLRTLPLRELQVQHGHQGHQEKDHR